MARMIPEIPDDFHGSEGEKRVFRRLRSLPDDIIVIHSFRWVHSGNANSATRNLTQGEGDFVLIDPSHGVLVVEVKGGEIRCENGIWFQRNRHTGVEIDINPEAQASNTKFRLIEEVSRRVAGGHKVLFCHAVWFPDGTIADRECLPLNCHTDMTLDASDLGKPEDGINRAFAYWSQRQTTKVAPRELTKRIFETICPSFEIVRSMRQQTDDCEEAMVRLTQEQARVVEFLDEQLHAAIVGPAGTGKTLLAVEKARRIATAAAPVLFLCYNAALKDHLRKYHGHPNVCYHNFHSFALEVAGPQCSLDKAVEVLLEHLCDAAPLAYEHVIIDEAQDFEDDWLQLLRARFYDQAFYVFFDRYQAVQNSRNTDWLDIQIPCRLSLSKNCRNTDAIAKFAYRTAGLKRHAELGLVGLKPLLHLASDDRTALAIVDDLVRQKIKHGDAHPDEIAILSLEPLRDESQWRIKKLGDSPTAESPTENHITVTTVRRFKGLEAKTLIIVDVDFRKAINPEWRLLLYIAASRARHCVHVVTTTNENELDGAVAAFASSENRRSSWKTLAKILGLNLEKKNNASIN